MSGTPSNTPQPKSFELETLALLAMHPDPLSRTELARLAGRFGVRIPRGNRGKDCAPSSTNLLPHLERWTQAGWAMHTMRDVWTVTPRERHLLLTWAAKRHQIHQLVDACQYNSYYSYDEERILLLRAALYEGNLGFIKDEVPVPRSGRRRQEVLDLLFDLLPLYGPPEATMLLPEPLREIYVDGALRLAAEGVFKAQDALGSVVEALGASDLQGMLQLVNVLTDDVPEEPPALDPDCAMTHEIYAVEALIRGDFVAARQTVLRAWAQSKGSRGTKKPRLEGPLSPLLTLLMATGDSQQRAIAVAQLASPGRKMSQEQGAYKIIEAFTNDRPIPPVDPGLSWQSALINMLVGAWRKTRQTHLRGTAVMTMKWAVGMKDKSPWIAEQLDVAQQAMQSAQNAPPASLLAMYQPPEPWLEALTAIETELVALQGSSAESTTDAEERLAWRVRVRDERELELHRSTFSITAMDRAAVTPDLEIEARLQKRTKSGWSKGRPVSPRKLHRDSVNAPWVTSLDRRILAHLRTARDWTGVERTVFDQTAPMALVGHPAVFWADDDATPLSIDRGRPHLTIERTQDKLLVRLEPEQLLHRPVFSLATGAHALTIYDRGEASPRLVELLGKGLKVPVKAEAHIQALVTKLAPILPVHSDLAGAGDDVETRAADPRPVVELERHHDGLKARLVLCPLGLGGPRVRAGEGASTLVSQIDGRAVRAERDLGAETRALQHVRESCPALERAERIEDEHVLEDLLDSLDLLYELDALDESEVEVLWKRGEPLRLAGRANASQLRLSIATAKEWFTAKGELEVDQDLVMDLRLVLEALPRRTGRFVRLDDQRFLALTSDLSARLETLEAASGGSSGDKIRLHPLMAGLIAGWKEDLDGLETSKTATKRLKRVDEAHALRPKVPKTLDAELREYQREGFAWMSRLAHWGAGACLADDMGLGKTVQALAILVARAAKGPALVVAPTSVGAGWVEQATRFAPTLNLIHAMHSQGLEIEALGPFDVLVCSYTVMALNIDALAETSFTTAVLDEAQAIKNPTTQRAQAAFRLKADFRLATTGTPVENRVSELWSLMRFLNPGLLGDAKSFDKRFTRPIQAQDDPSPIRQLRHLVSPFILRRNKREVLTELPPRTEIVLDVEPSKEERAFSEALRQRALERIEASGDDPKRSTMTILAELTRLRMAACHPALVDPQSSLPSSKLDAFAELVQELIAGGHRALVFSQFVSFLTHARTRLDEAGIQYQYLDGSTPTKKRKAAVTDFQSGEGDLFLISLKAGGSGLNLTAADYVVHLDPWWNPAVEDQASDRAHRIGQTRPVTVYRLVTKGSIEERVLALHGAKRDLAEQLLSGRDEAKVLDAEALLGLLKGEG